MDWIPQCESRFASAPLSYAALNALRASVLPLAGCATAQHPRHVSHSGGTPASLHSQSLALVLAVLVCMHLPLAAACLPTCVCCLCRSLLSLHA